MAGGFPKVTYVARDELALESQLEEYLNQRYKILSLTGPTKSGKTVLVRKIAPTAVELPGGSIDSIGTFWDLLADQLGGFQIESKERSFDERVSSNRKVEGGFQVVVKGSATAGEQHELGETRTHALGRNRPSNQVALEKLTTDRDIILFVDDFHYIDQGTQTKIVRALKGPIFDGTRVIFASVPHRAYDAVRVEKEMTGRLQPLPIPLWSERDLRSIAAQGFQALNLGAPTTVTRRLAQESFGSPLLMQDFCRSLCGVNGVKEASESPTLLAAPGDFPTFLRGRATGASKTAFDLLAQGPRQRSDRKQRRFADGRTGDIYEAVLAAIAATGPRTELPYDELRASIRKTLADEPPQRQEVTRVLDEITKIARRIEGEPVIEYDDEYDTIYISDPFFAFFLRWGEPTAVASTT